MIEVSRSTVNTGIVNWIKVDQLATGGFILDDSVVNTPGYVVPAGTPVYIDEATRLATIAKLAVVYEIVSSGAAYKVNKGSNLAVGMSIKKAGGTAYAITAIDITNAAFDLVTTGTTLGTAAVGDALYVDDTATTKANGLTYADAELNANGNVEVGVVLRGTVYARRIPPVPTTVQALLTHIIFSQSY
jgi:hypothetical protein